MDSSPDRGRVLLFPRPQPPALEQSPKPRDTTPFLLAPRSRLWWLTWWVMAWAVAASRVRLAAAQYEVFGVEATLAFLVAVVLPLVSVPQLFGMGGDALRSLRRRFSED